MSPLCNFDEKRGIFSECFVENVHICIVNIKIVLQNHCTLSVLTKLFLLSTVPPCKLTIFA